MTDIRETPQSLAGLAREATRENRDVSLDPGQVRQIAEQWHADQEKIAYLESLIVRIGRGSAESRVTVDSAWRPTRDSLARLLRGTEANQG